MPAAAARAEPGEAPVVPEKQGGATVGQLGLLEVVARDPRLGGMEAGVPLCGLLLGDDLDPHQALIASASPLLGFLMAAFLMASATCPGSRPCHASCAS